MWVFAQHILQILLKHLIRFNRYISLMLKFTSLNIHEKQVKLCTAFHQQYRCFSDECQLPTAHSVFKQCSRCPTSCSNTGLKSAAKWYDSLSIHSCGKSFRIMSFSSAILVIFGVHLIAFKHCVPYMIIHGCILLVHLL